MERILKLGNVELRPVSEMPVKGEPLVPAKSIGYVEGFVIATRSTVLGFLQVGRRRGEMAEMAPVDFAWYTPDRMSSSRFVVYDLFEALDRIFLGLPIDTTPAQKAKVEKYIERLVEEHAQVLPKPAPDAERFQAKVSSVHGHGDTWTKQGTSIGALMTLADVQVPEDREVVIRGELTSDGSRWPVGRGRVVAQREHGRWSRF